MPARVCKIIYLRRGCTPGPAEGAYGATQTPLAGGDGARSPSQEPQPASALLASAHHLPSPGKKNPAGAHEQSGTVTIPGAGRRYSVVDTLAVESAEFSMSEHVGETRPVFDERLQCVRALLTFPAGLMPRTLGHGQQTGEHHVLEVGRTGY